MSFKLFIDLIHFYDINPNNVSILLQRNSRHNFPKDFFRKLKLLQNAYKLSKLWLEMTKLKLMLEEMESCH